MLGHGALGEFALGEFEIASTARPVVGDPGGGKGRRHRSDWKPERGFSRKYFDEMLAAERAALAARKAAENRKRLEQQEVLAEAALAAQEAIDSVEDGSEVDFTKLTRALDAAVSAKNFATSLKRAKDAIAAAQAIINADDEEEEAMMLLLLN